MIFVTVGTHEQPFNRLIEEIDRLKKENIIQDEVIIQRGYSTYTPKYCEFYGLIEWNVLQEYLLKADVVITHGGPASFIDVLKLGKTPIVVPRQSKYKEHVNDHQLIFSNEIKKRGINIEIVEEMDELLEKINKVKNISLSDKVESNNVLFNDKLIEIIKQLF